MEQTYALDIARQGMQVGLTVLLPILAVALFVGILVSVFQALTQVQEMTLTFVPKLLAVAIVGVVLGNWMLSMLVSFTNTCFERLVQVARGG